MIRLISIAISVATVTCAAADYYVDAGRTSSGSGTEASPWKEWGDIDWSAVGASLASEDVTIYLSSRATWSGGQYFRIVKSGTASRALVVNGDSKYNLTASGTAVWLTESSGNRATLTGGGAPVITNSTTNITIRGIYNPTNSFGWSIGDSNPSTNISLITLVNNVIGGSGQQGIFAGYWETGCHSLRVAQNVISNTQLESIYIGHYNYMTQSITNCVVESNIVMNCGLFLEGEIDIKPPVHGAIVRYNTVFRTAFGLGGSSCAVVVAGNNAQVYNNRFFGHQRGGDGDWGQGIQVNADGADGVGLAITNFSAWNNLIYGNGSEGIRFIATTAPGLIGGVSLWNNTIVANQRLGIEGRSSGGRTVEITDMRNNIMAGNTNYDVSLQNTDVTLASANHNLYFRGSGNPFFYQGAEKSFAQWQGLGFDASGVNADPQFVNASSGDFRLNNGSPAIAAGADLSALFTTDLNGDTRVTWDMGAIKFSTVSRPPIVKLRKGGR